MQTEIKDIYNLYQLEAENIEAPVKKGPSFWFIMLQATGIFFVITMIVFFVANYQFIKSQLVDWQKKETEKNEYTDDSDEDGVPNWWEQKYGFSNSNPKDVFQDKDNDLANNLIEYQFNTDPNDPDSDRDGYFDGEEIRKGFNPNGVGRMDSDKDGIYDWWEEKYGMDKNEPADAAEDYDADDLKNLDEFKYSTDPYNPDSDSDGQLDGQEVQLGTNPMGEGLLPKLDEVSASDPDGDKLDNFFESLYGTDSNVADTDGDGFDDFKELSRGYDPTGEGLISGMLEIPAIGVNAPIVWSQNPEEKKIQADLEQGIVHYPSTPFVGMRGNVYLTGHSSYYAWSKSPYKEVLKNLGNVKANDRIMIHLTMKNGRKVEIVYVVQSAEVVKPDDPRLFQDVENYEMTLVTCWPIGTDWKRLMLKTVLDSPLP